MNDEETELDQSDLIELAFFEALMVRMPQDAEILKAVADIYTRVGRYEDGLVVDQRLSSLCGDDPMVWYNLACSQALLRMSLPAMESLKRAVELGYDDAEWMKKDEDLRSLREERGFKTLLNKLTGVTEPEPDH